MTVYGTGPHGTHGWWEAGYFLDRYEATGNLEDLDQALTAYQKAGESAPPDSPKRLVYLNGLGRALRLRFERCRKPADIGQAVNILDEVIDQTPKGSAHRPDRLNNLGLALQARYELSGTPADIARAIRVYKAALKEVGQDAPRRLQYLNNLARALSLRYDSTRDSADLNQSIGILKYVAAQTPDNAPERPGRLENLAAVKAQSRRAVAGERQKKILRYRCIECGMATTRRVDQTGWPIGHEHHGRRSFVGVLMMLGAAIAATVATWVLLLVSQTIANFLFSGIMTGKPSLFRDLGVAIVLLLFKLLLPVLLIKEIGLVIFKAADRSRSGNPVTGAIIGLVAGILLLLGLVGIDYFNVPSYGTVLGDLAGFEGLGGQVLGLIFNSRVMMLIIGLCIVTVPPIFAFNYIESTPFCDTCNRYMRIESL